MKKEGLIDTTKTGRRPRRNAAAIEARLYDVLDAVNRARAAARDITKGETAAAQDALIGRTILHLDEAQAIGAGKDMTEFWRAAAMGSEVTL